ncbi:unnamed protein product, partial [Ceratitis capitata]
QSNIRKAETTTTKPTAQRKYNKSLKEHKLRGELTAAETAETYEHTAVNASILHFQVEEEEEEEEDRKKQVVATSSLSSSGVTPSQEFCRNVKMLKKIAQLSLMVALTDN